MKQNKQFMLLALAFLLTLPCVAHEQVQLAAKAALGNMTNRSISELYKVRNAAANPDRREIVVQATIAGLYAVGDAEKARKLESELCDDGFGSAVFLSSFMDDCANCKTRPSSACGSCGGAKKVVNKGKAIAVCQELLNVQINSMVVRLNTEDSIIEDYLLTGCLTGHIHNTKFHNYYLLIVTILFLAPGIEPLTIIKLYSGITFRTRRF